MPTGWDSSAPPRSDTAASSVTWNWAAHTLALADNLRTVVPRVQGGSHDTGIRTLCPSDYEFGLHRTVQLPRFNTALDVTLSVRQRHPTAASTWSATVGR